MQDNKISFIQSLQLQEKYDRLGFDQVIVILSSNQLKLPEVRKYLLHVYPSIDVSWKTMSPEQINAHVPQALQYVSTQRKNWKEEDIAYNNYLAIYENELLSITQQLNIKSDISKKELYQNMTRQLQIKNAEINAEINLEGNQYKIKEYHKLKQFQENLQKLLIYEDLRAKVERIDDLDLQKEIDQILKQNAPSKVKQTSQMDRLIQSHDKYEKDMSLVKSKLKQIFLFYCREHNLKSLSFEDMNKYSQLLDLRLYLLYIKDYKYQEINKYQYSLIKLTELFKKNATNTLTLTFQQFYNLHLVLFEIKSIVTNKKELLQIKQTMIQYQKLKYADESQRLKELLDILSNNKVMNNLRYENLKTEQNQLKKASSVSNLGLKIPSFRKSKVTESSQYTNRNKKSLPSSKESQLSSMNRNFIQSIREELNNQERGIMKKKSYQKIASSNNPETITSIHLPKILKMSSEEISNQGIYQSLKKFPAFDYLAQQKKIRGIIGLSEGDDQEYMSQYLNTQLKNKRQIKQSNIIQRQQKRKQKICESKVMKHHCRKYHPDEVQPYMRF